LQEKDVERALDNVTNLVNIKTGMQQRGAKPD
jgi:hypothetical protein